METLQFADRLARERRRRGLTQEQVAEHLGVTKAAVSKWERGASLPDMGQMPRIASLFAITLDELFGYEPQMGTEDVAAVYASLLAQFAEDSEAAFDRCHELAVRYWSCPELLHYLAMALYVRVPQAEGGAVRPAEGAAARYAERAVGYFRRVRELARHDGGGADAERLAHRSVEPEAVLLHQLGRSGEAVALLEPLVASGPSMAPALLAGVYRDEGDRECADAMLQKVLAFSLVDAECALSGMVAACENDAAALEPVVEVAEALGASEAVALLNPAFLPSVRYAWASALAAGSEDERALAALERFADAFEASWGTLGYAPTAPVFDKIQDVLWNADVGDAREAAAQAVAAMRTRYATMLENDARWDSLRADARFTRTIERIGAQPNPPSVSHARASD